MLASIPSVSTAKSKSGIFVSDTGVVGTGLGAGGGGFMIFITQNEDIRTKLRKNFSKLREVKLNLTDDRAGIIYKEIK